VDCTKIAKKLARQFPGKVFRLKPNPDMFPPGADIKLGAPHAPEWRYHDVHYDPETNMVRDPMTNGNSDPVPFDNWAQNFPNWDSYTWGPL
jgi:hypothetical protein